MFTFHHHFPCTENVSVPFIRTPSFFSAYLFLSMWRPTVIVPFMEHETHLSRTFCLPFRFAWHNSSCLLPFPEHIPYLIYWIAKFSCRWLMSPSCYPQTTPLIPPITHKNYSRFLFIFNQRINLFCRLMNIDKQKYYSKNIIIAYYETEL